MKKLYVHIGPHKTGSTYLQNALFNNRDALKQAGVCYPVSDLGEMIAHHKLAEVFQAQKASDQKRMVEKIIKESGDDDILLSSENFDRLGEDAIWELAKYFSGYEVSIIYYSRNIADLLVSVWQEEVKHGSVVGWDRFLAENLLRPFQSLVLNKRKVIDRWANVFGKGRIIVFDYDGCLGSGKDIFSVVLDLLNLPDFKRLDKAAKINKSMSYTHIEVIRALNSIITKKHGLVFHKVRSAFIEYLKENPNCSYLGKLFERIEGSLSEVVLEGVFSIDFMENFYYKEYSENIFYHSKKRKIKAFMMPGDEWLLSDDVSIALHKISDRVEKIFLQSNLG